MDRSFSFAVVQARPDSIRGERVNVGIVVDTPEGPDVRLPEVRKIFALTGHSWSNVVEAFEEQLRRSWADGGADAFHRVSELSETFQVAEPGTLVASPNDYEERVKKILSFFVDRPKLTQPSAPVTARYVIAMPSNPQDRPILLDTQTGQTWFQVSTGTTPGDEFQWLPMDKTTELDWSRLIHPERQANSN